MKSNTPKVSVLIPSFNYGIFLPEAIDSVLAQTYDAFELIIVDNCSTDNTVEIVEEYIKKDSRIKLHVNEVNIGMYRNYNQALLLAQGEYIKFLNADDKFHVELLEKFVKILDDYPTVSLVTSHRQYFGDKKDILFTPFLGVQPGREMIIETLIDCNWVGEPTTVMFRRKNLNLGLFDTSLLMFADYDMWLRQMQIGNIYVVDEVLSYFRIHNNQGTVTLNDNPEKYLFNRLQHFEYIRYVLQINRFSYDYLLENSRLYDKVFNYLALNSSSLFKYYLTGSIHRKRIRFFLNSLIIQYVKLLPSRLRSKVMRIIKNGVQRLYRLFNGKNRFR